MGEIFLTKPPKGTFFQHFVSK